MRLAGLLSAAACAFAPAALRAQSVEELSELSIEELARLPVSSASKREEPLSSAPTALYLITGEDIISSAATSLPETLRLAPNLNVQQVNGHEYTISARGFNSLETANKLLVLVDGRSVYSTLHSGIFWDLQAPLLEDLAQIEVISGPGGTLYGPNAVNGVINVVSRDAGETKGALLRGTAGAYEQRAAARYGFALGETGAARVYFNWFDRGDLPRAAFGPVLNDRLHGWQAGFRSDFESGENRFTLQGDLFDNEIDSSPGDGNEGHNLLGRWTRDLGADKSARLQIYYDRTERRYLLTVDELEVVDAEGQLNLGLGKHDFVIGGGARTTRDRFVNNLNAFQLNPQSRRLWVFNAFVQDRIALSPTLSVIAGIKAEQTSFTGFAL
ncbi:MAG TPA: TonB-dependent receptor plug domain-containing protein, partial [Allosphingosinicella sp.]|nr:TonB-dependent receptor plug domain-containing protein [Allosphingosinicella sp.]